MNFFHGPYLAKSQCRQKKPTLGIIMKCISRIAVALAASVVSAAAFATPIITLDNAGFESPNVSGGYTYLNSASYGWKFSGLGTGVASNGSGFNVTGASGNQAGFLQGQGSSFSQNFVFAGEQVSISFMAESRPYGGGGNPISVMIDNQVLSFGNTTSFIPGTNTSFSIYTSDLISLSSGVHSLAFTGLGTDGSDVTSFIDNVTVNAVPEPTTVALLGLGLLGVAASRRKSAKNEN
jgi:hypothetical protein